MKLLITHISFNRGTTDYFCDYLCAAHENFYVLKHPMPDLKLSESVLYFYDGREYVLVRKFSASKNQLISYIQNFLVSTFVILKYRSKLQYVFGFGSFNVMPAIFLKPLLSIKPIFYGVDYSVNRFENIFLSKIYYLTESIACRYSDLVISSSKRQEDARLRTHKLNKNKSIVVSNGINHINTKINQNKYGKPYFIYLGSITKQHGLLDFIRHVYLNLKSDVCLEIFGDGLCKDDLVEFISQNKLGDKVRYYGRKSKSEIEIFIREQEGYGIGIAPYVSNSNFDHVYYGDSLKIKEYLAMGLPFLCSDAVFVSDDLLKFGKIYKNNIELNLILTRLLDEVIPDHTLPEVVLQKYTWKSQFDFLNRHLPT